MKIKLSIESHRLNTIQKNLILQDCERNEFIQFFISNKHSSLRSQKWAISPNLQTLCCGVSHYKIVSSINAFTDWILTRCSTVIMNGTWKFSYPIYERPSKEPHAVMGTLKLLTDWWIMVGGLLTIIFLTCLICPLPPHAALAFV